MKRRSVLLSVPALPALAWGKEPNSAVPAAKQESDVVLELSATATADKTGKVLTIIVRLSNLSGKEVIIHDINAMRGWESIRLELIDSSSARLWTTRAPRDWTGRTWRTLVLQPKGHYEFQITTNDRWWAWPINLGRGEAKKCRVHFDQPTKPVRAKGEMWAGHLESDFIDLPAPISQYLPVFSL